jgi:hypothetical protein
MFWIITFWALLTSFKPLPLRTPAEPTPTMLLLLATAIGVMAALS